LLHLGRICGTTVGFQRVFGSQLPTYILSLCSNYNARTKYPIDEAIKLAKELDSVGIEAKVRWFLKYMTSEEESLIEKSNWNEEYY
jgi:hypothetical protein